MTTGQRETGRLLKDALVRTVAETDHADFRAVAVHAKDDVARAFYEHFHFVHSPTAPYRLQLLMKDVRCTWRSRLELLPDLSQREAPATRHYPCPKR